MLDEEIMVLPQELLILGAAVKSGILEALRKTTTCTDLAKELTLDPRAVGIVLEALADLGRPFARKIYSAMWTFNLPIWN